MIPLAVEFYDVVVFFHILAVVVAFGPTFAYGMFFSVASRHDLRAMPVIGRAVIAWDSTIGTAAQVVVLLAGIYAVSERWELSDFFVGWGIVRSSSSSASPMASCSRPRGASSRSPSTTSPRPAAER